MAEYNVESYNVAALRVLDGVTGAESVAGDLYGVTKASLEIYKGSVEQTKEPGVMVPYEWFNYGTLIAEGAYIPFPLIESITGEPIVEYTTVADYNVGNALDPLDFNYETDLEIARNSPEHIFEQLFYSETSFNPASRPVLIRRASQDTANTLRILDMVLFRVYFSVIEFVENNSEYGQQNEYGQLVNFKARVVMSEVNERGEGMGTLPGGVPKRAAGRLVSRPG